VSFVVVLVVATGVFFFFQSNRRERNRWLKKLDLLGRWQLQDQEAELVLNGRFDQGQFRYVTPPQEGVSREIKGQWVVRGSQLELRSEQTLQVMQLVYLAPGQIGLQDESGERFVYAKVQDNVVPLRRKRP